MKRAHALLGGIINTLDGEEDDEVPSGGPLSCTGMKMLGGGVESSSSASASGSAPMETTPAAKAGSSEAEEQSIFASLKVTKPNSMPAPNSIPKAKAKAKERNMT